MFEISPKKVGSASTTSTDGNFATMSGTAADEIQDSGVPIDTSGSGTKFLDDTGAYTSPAGTANFSYNLIEAADTITVPAKQQMVVSNKLILEGNLILNGDLALV